MKGLFLFVSLFFSVSLVAQNRVVVSKQNLQISVINLNGDTILSIPCGLGEEFGQKESLCDHRTPEGVFCMVSTKKMKQWAHPLDEKISKMEGAFGTTIIHLVNAQGLETFIHGTRMSQLVGKRKSAGCILVDIPDMIRLSKLVKKSTIFTISKDAIPIPAVMEYIQPKLLTEEERLDSILDARGEQIVDTIHQLYSYDKMVLDLKLLQRRYPEVINYEMRDTTSQGRIIPVVYFGGKNQQKKIMIQAAMHAREYITTPLVMAMLEYYAKSYNSQSYGGKTFAETFDSVSLVILPMANPDGVEISQRGIDGVVTHEARQWIQSQIDEGKDLTQIKSNARGVDINRNFANGFDFESVGKKSKDLYFYMGEKPYSEVENQLMLEVARENNFSLFLNYHTRGHVVYWGCQNAKENVNFRAQKLAELIKFHTGYRLIGPKYQKPGGTWADDVETIFERPSATIEVGTQNPVPMTEFQDIYHSNINIWVDLCQRVLCGDI